jgi:hypothetical protein
MCYDMLCHAKLYNHRREYSPLPSRTTMYYTLVLGSTTMYYTVPIPNRADPRPFPFHQATA